MAWIATMLVGGAWWVRRDVAAYARAVASRSRHGLARGLVGCLAAGLRTGARPLRLGGGLATTAAGILLTVYYLRHGSLLRVMIAHAVIDIIASFSFARRSQTESFRVKHRDGLSPPPEETAAGLSHVGRFRLTDVSVHRNGENLVKWCMVAP
jgi:hypothetical protein